MIIEALSWFARQTDVTQKGIYGEMKHDPRALGNCCSLSGILAQLRFGPVAVWPRSHMLSSQRQIGQLGCFAIFCLFEKAWRALSKRSYFCA
jgi:hypothetical protein